MSKKSNKVAKAKIARVFEVKKSVQLFLNGEKFEPTAEQKIEMKFFGIDGITSKSAETKTELHSFEYNTDEELKTNFFELLAVCPELVSNENLVLRK